VRALLTTVLGLSLAASAAAVDVFPLADVEPGLRGIGKTVFEGERVEEFEVEILGVLDNVGPKQSIILGRLSGGPLARTGVMAGMSGSPVYVDGKLVGAVAFSFEFATEPITGIRPIEDMLAGSGAAPLQVAGDRMELAGLLRGENGLLPRASAPPGGESGLLPIATPVAFAGFSEGTLRVFGERLRTLGLRPLQGLGGRSRDGFEQELEPGAMVSVSLIDGDLQVAASGTVTHIEGDRIWAFGHPFISAGPAELPLRRASVLTLVPNRNNSFKLAASGPVAGKINLDRSAGVGGVLGQEAATVPVSITVNGSDDQDRNYSLRLARDPSLTPFLLQMSVFSVIDAHERQVGAASVRLQGEARFAGGEPPLRLDNVYAAPGAVGLQAALGTAMPLAWALQSADGELDVEEIELSIEARIGEQATRLARAWAAKQVVRAGENLELTAIFRRADGSELRREVSYRLPGSLAAGELFVTFSEGSRLNMLEAVALSSELARRDPGDWVRAANRLRPNDRFYVRLWRQEPAFRLGGDRLSAPPASVRAVLETPVAAGGGSARESSSTLAEIAMEGFDGAVRGEASLKIVVTP